MPKELDLSFLDDTLRDFEQENMQRDLDRIQAAFKQVFETLEGDAEYKAFWAGKGVYWPDSVAGVSKLGSMLHDWLQREGVVDKFDAEKHRYEPVPPRTQTFIQSTRIVLELAMALGAVLATQEVDKG